MIKIDLRDLTPEHLEECRPHLGACHYTAPCIIGTLMKPGERHDNPYIGIDCLLRSGRVHMPEDQQEDALKMQTAFDSSRWNDVVAIASKYMKEKPDAE